MIHNPGLDTKFWAEAVCTAVIVRNRCPTVEVDNMTQYECFNGKKPDVPNFKVFGCKACLDVLFDEDEFIQQKKFMKIGNLNDSAPDDQEEPQENKPSAEHVILRDRDTIDHGERTEETSNCRETEVEQQPRRSTRKLEPPDRHDVLITSNWWQNNVACINNKEQWKQALDNECSAHIKNNSWTLGNLPEGGNAIDCRWVFKVKYNGDWSVERHKARLDAKGYSQEPGLDYDETFSPVAKYTSILSLVGIANQLDLEVHQMDVSTAFLNGELEEEICMKQPERYVKERLEHWTAAKRILRYMKGTIDYGITFDGNKQTEVQLNGYVDADWRSNPNGRKSQSGYLFTLCGRVISWASKKQSVVALSSTEAEYDAASLACQEAVWLRVLHENISFVQNKPTMIKEDNRGAITLSKNPKYHPRTKHLADLLTKPLGKTMFQRFRELME
ncbi:Hypothetical predicted protein, partial [Paramuricea clavata]